MWLSRNESSKPSACFHHYPRARARPAHVAPSPSPLDGVGRGRHRGMSPEAPQHLGAGSPACVSQLRTSPCSLVHVVLWSADLADELVDRHESGDDNHIRADLVSIGLFPEQV
jgi:hypothetical protein